MPPPPVDALERALTRLIRRAVLPTSGQRAREEAGVTLDRGPYTSLVRIAERGPLRLSALAELVGLDVSTVSRHVAKLEQAGHVERAPDPDDGRASLLALTDSGLDVLERVRDVRRHHLRDRLATWDDAEVERLADLLDRLLDAFDDDRTR